MNASVLPLYYPGGIWEGNTTFVKERETVQVTEIKIGYPTTISNSVLREKLGMYPLKTSKDGRKLKLQYNLRNMPKKRLPAILDRTVSDEVATERTGKRWDSVL